MDKKELIRVNAIKVIAREGFHHAKVKTIAEEAGIAAGTVYLYFKCKEEILDYIFSVEHKKRADYVNDLYQRDEPIEKVIDGFIDFNYNCFTHEPDTAKVLYQEAVTVQLFKKQKAHEYMEKVYQAFSKILIREKKRGGLREEINDDVLSASIMYFLRFSSFNILKQGLNIDFENWKKQLRSFVLYGIMGG